MALDTAMRAVAPADIPKLDDIKRLDRELAEHFYRRLVVDPRLTRQLVSFQANKDRAAYRWYKFKEAFSASLVERLLSMYGVISGVLLDPFAGSGTALFAASALGMDADGIEVLPIGLEIIATRLCLEREFTAADFAALERWLADRPWTSGDARQPLPELRITHGAYPEGTRQSIERYVAASARENERVQRVLRFALLCVLEDISYTRRDGQYLRWDWRSGRQQGSKPFNKGKILGFDEAIETKLQEIMADASRPNAQLSLFPSTRADGRVNVRGGSCLDILPRLPDNTYHALMTSPPYCNRYDYTRTYALELALLGVGEKGIVDLRQRMLSCTVESRPKELLAMNPRWAGVLEVVERQDLLQAILAYLEDQKARRLLNNNGIPRMVRGYFYEMACVIAECARVLKPGAPMFMVNDNVRYAGASISVDMILSNIAEKVGFAVDTILVVPNGKGNSSQQMGEHGRDPLRKCVYVWRKRS